MPALMVRDRMLEGWSAVNGGATIAHFHSRLLGRLGQDNGDYPNLSIDLSASLLVGIYDFQSAGLTH